MPYYKRDGQPDAEDVYRHLDQHAAHRVVDFQRIQQPENYKIHEPVDRDTVQRSRYRWPLDHKSQLSAGQKEDRRCSRRDHEMYDQAQRRTLESPVERVRTQKTGRDRF